MSNQNPAAENILGTENPSKLLRKFAVPSVVAMLVSSLYNIVDQIFIGQYVGTIGNAATNIAFPLTTICIAIGVLCGIGGSARFSIELGKGNKDEAGSCVGNALGLALILGIVYSALAAIFLTPLLNAFGATETSLPYALDYTEAIIVGMPFLILSNVMSNFIRADGSPKFSMMCMVIGGVINIGLDALFVCDWGFNWGMAGAAWATVISQIISFVISFLYFGKFKTVELTSANFKFNLRKALKIASLGASNSLNQIAICAVQIVMNNTLAHYGALSVYGADNALGAFGIVMKVNSIMIAVFVGVAQGAQPIIGYNYGALKLHRSKKVCMLAATVCMLFSALGFIAFQFFPEYIISIFGSGDSLYNEFAAMTMRTFLFMIVLNGAQMTFANYFSAIGKPAKGVILSMTRQFILIIPLMLILPVYFGIEGVLYAAPITDLFSFILSVGFIVYEFRREGYKTKSV